MIQLPRLRQQGEHPPGFGLVETCEREADVNEGVFSGHDLGDVFEADPLQHTAEIEPPHEQIVLAVNLDDLTGNAEAHGEAQGLVTGGLSQLSRTAATTNCPRHNPPSPGETRV